MIKNINKNVAEFLIDEIANLGVEYIFMIPGAHIIPLSKAISKAKNIKPIIATHELAAGFMAIGYARATGKTGVVMSIGGPGAAYMVGAGITAKADDVPLVFLTGDIPKSHHGCGEFQDASAKGTNDSAIFKETVGESIVCRQPEDISNIIIEILKHKKKFSPLHVQIPVDIQIKEIDFQLHKDKIDKYTNIQIQETIPNINFEKKKKIVFFLGRKILGIIDYNKLKKFVQKNEIGVVTDMKTRGVIPEKYRESLGYVGFNSDYRALEVLNKNSYFVADQIFAIGVTKNLIKQYIDPSIAITHITPFALKAWLIIHEEDSVTESSIAIRKQWLNNLLKIIPPKPTPMKFVNKVSYLEIFEIINKVIPKNTVFCLDAGQPRRAGSMLLQCNFHKSLIQSDTLSPMGSGICASIGVKLAVKKKPVISIFGDGSMRMHGMELATAMRYNTSIIFILCDNLSYASSPKSQEMKEITSLPAVDWISFAKSFKMKVFCSDNKETFEKNLTNALGKNEPILLWVKVPMLLDDEFKETKILEYKNWLTEINNKL